METVQHIYLVVMNSGLHKMPGKERGCCVAQRGWEYQGEPEPASQESGIFALN